jgi:hypothetical protein
VIQGTLTARGHVQAPEVEALLQYAGAQIRADLSAQLQEPLPRYRAALRIDGLALAQVLPQAQGAQQARFQLQGRGWTGERRQGTLDATVETTGFNLAPGLTARLRTTLSGTALQLEQLQMRSSVATLTSSGTLSASSKATVQYRLTLGDLAPLQPLLGMSLQASGDLSGEVQGPLTALRTRGTLQLGVWRVADFRGQRLQATFTAAQIPAAPQATLRAQLVKVQGPTLAPSSVNVEGTYAAQQGTVTVAVTEGPYQRSRLVGNVSLAAGGHSHRQRHGATRAPAPGAHSWERTENGPALGTHHCGRLRSWPRSPGLWPGPSRGANPARLLAVLRTGRYPGRHPP